MTQMQKLLEKQKKSRLLLEAGWIVGHGVWIHPDVNGGWDLDRAVIIEFERRYRDA